MTGASRIPVLDGWRGISILCVLAGHMLPLGPKFLELNEVVAATGMSLFFILSGFLITSILARKADIVSFAIHRVCRIVPLAWAYLIVVLCFSAAPLRGWIANLGFFANLPPFYLEYTNEHFWSLGVEMQFYAAIGFVVLLFGSRGLWLIPILCSTVTALRVVEHAEISIVTWLRLDEILAGGCLALLYVRGLLMPQGPIITTIAALLLLAASHPAFGWLNYLRPYFAAAAVGSTLGTANIWFRNTLTSRPLVYLAEISFALYVIHPLTASGWFNQGTALVRYSKRPLSFALSFLFAHLSTRYYEQRWIALGHRLSAHRPLPLASARLAQDLEGAGGCLIARNTAGEPLQRTATANAPGIKV
jgi:peptidoglycan/LPS O-acetylase OafA/YrhL